MKIISNALSRRIAGNALCAGAGTRPWHTFEHVANFLPLMAEVHRPFQRLVNSSIGRLEFYERRLCRFFPGRQLRFAMTPVKLA